MSEESHWPWRRHKSGHRLTGCKDVFVFVLHSAMNKSRPVYFQWALRQTPQVPEIFRKKPAASPFHRGARDRIEIFEIGNPAHSFVVIAADDCACQRADALHNFIRIG